MTDRSSNKSAVCVFMGSSPGVRPEYEQAARSFGQSLAARGLAMVYGGAAVGLMGVMADAMLTAGGVVIGVIPQVLVDKEVAHPRLSQQHVVGSMHERKALMAKLATAFVALPGGFGTLDELFEIMTWAQIGIHNKPIGLLDVAGFYQPLLRMLAHIEAEGLARVASAEVLSVSDDPDTLFELLGL